MIKALSEPKSKIRINKKKLEEVGKYFNKSRHKFSKKEIDKHRKAFYHIKNYRHLSSSKIKEVRKNLNKLKNFWCLKSLVVMLIVLIMMILIIMMMALPMMINTEELDALEVYLDPIEIITNQ